MTLQLRRSEQRMSRDSGESCFTMVEQYPVFTYVRPAHASVHAGPEFRLRGQTRLGLDVWAHMYLEYLSVQ